MAQVFSEASEKQKRISKQIVKFGCLPIGIIILIVFVISLFNKPAKKQSYTKSQALAQAQYFVEQRLKAPGSAKWSYNDNDVTAVNDSTFLVSSWVDSQNSFGALIRSKYIITIYFYPTIQKVKYENLIME